MRDFRLTAYLLAAFACFIGVMHIPPFLTSPIEMWGWQNWLLGFAPAAYLVFAALVAVPCERWTPRLGLLAIPLILAPLILVTAFIVFAIYVDFAKTISGGYSWSQNLYTLLLASLCPVVWYYQLVASRRAWRVARTENRR